ncbi:MAG: YihY/virulence factor BrkB family protein [Pseudomonadota bacterium]
MPRERVRLAKRFYGNVIAFLNRFTAWRFLAEVIRRFNEDQGAVLAGYIAYASMLAGLPFLIFTITLAGLLIGEAESAQAVQVLFDSVPEHVAKTLEPVLNEVLTVDRRGILTVAALGTLYGASNGVEAIRIGLDRAYDIPSPRNFLMNRLVSIGFVFISFLVFGTLAVLIIFAPLAFQLIEALTGQVIPASADIARYLIGAVLLYGMLWLMHWILPARPMHKKRLWPGILVSMLIWVAIASALSVYVANTPTYALTYGALAGVIVTLLFFYLTGVAIIFGAQVNAVLNFGWDRGKIETGKPRPGSTDPAMEQGP